MSTILKHARQHYFKGAYAQTLFGDLSAIGGVPTYDAYGIQVPRPDTLLLPVQMNSEQEESLTRTVPHLQKGLYLEENLEEGQRQLILTSSGILKKRRRLTLEQQEGRLKILLHSEKEESLLDTLLRETVVGEALTEYWVKTGFFKHRSIEDFDKELVVEAALEKPVEVEGGRHVTAEDATKELEKARKLLLQITPKSLLNRATKNR